MITLWSLALAQHVEPLAENVLTVDDVPWATTAVLNPSVVHDGDRFTMVFESEVAIEGCDSAAQIGVATSIDGLIWEVFAAPILGPTPTHPCGLRDPALADTSDGWFILAHDPSNDTHVLGRHRRGRFIQRDVVGLEGLSAVSFARLDGEWFAAGLDPVEGLVTATSYDGLSWARQDNVLSAGAAWWAADEVLSPSLSCADGASFPWTMHLGGRIGAERSFTFGSSPDMRTWFYSLAVDVWQPDEAWDSWDAVVEGPSAWVIYGQHGALSLATSTGELPLAPTTRDCAR